MTDLTRPERRALLLTALLSGWLAALLPVFSQEAYYWTYAQHPDLSYFDHPPMVAWSIWVGTHLFGDGEIGIRIATWALGMVTALAGRALLVGFDVGERGRVAWLYATIAVPAFVAARFLANPDAPLVGFWALTLWLLWRTRSGTIGAWVLAGLAAGGALLSKYTAVFLAVSGVLVLLFDPAMRRQLLRPGPYVGVVVAALVFSPVVIWNARNGYESFLFQTQGRFELAEFGLRWFGSCIGEQIGIVNPVFAVLAPLALVWLGRRALGGDVRAIWLLAFGLPLPLYLLTNSLWMQVKINWFTPAYVALFVGGAWWWDATGFGASHPRWRKATQVATVILAVGLALAPAIRFVPARSGTSWTGWEEIGARADHWARHVVTESGSAGPVFFFAADYRDAAQLGRNLELLHRRGVLAGAVPGPTLTDNVFGIPALQYDHWTAPAELVGGVGIYVLPRAWDRASDVEKARPFFESIDVVEHVVVERLGIHVFDADILLCRGYRGPHPDEHRR